MHFDWHNSDHKKTFSKWNPQSLEKGKEIHFPHVKIASINSKKMTVLAVIFQKEANNIGMDAKTEIKMSLNHS